MGIHPAIKKLSGVFLLLLFAFSMLPKKTLHDLFARHKDRIFLASDSQAGQVSRSGFQCHCDNLVIESPFLAEQTPPHGRLLDSGQRIYSSPLTIIYSSQLPTPDLRGPPQA